MVTLDHVPAPLAVTGTPRFARGKSEADLNSENLRAIAFTTDQNGYRITVDMIAAPGSKSTCPPKS